MCSPTWETHIPCDMFFPAQETHIASYMCSPTWETPIPSDMCFPTWETHIACDMFFPTQETHTSLLGKHVSLVICVPYSH